MNRYVQYMYSYPHKTAYRPLQNVNLRDYIGNLAGEGQSLYLHLPFCESKCGYCNLFSVAGCGRMQMEAYLEALVRQMKQYREILPEGTVFGDFTIGGGTPLLLDPGQLARLFQDVRTSMPLRKDCHIVIETAPKQTTREKAVLLKELGVTRVSMGIQSFQEQELAWLGRHHNGEQARRAADLLMGTGFSCVNFDFIYGLPGQTKGSLVHSLRTALSFSPDEIFLYPLYIKHGVSLEKAGKGDTLDSDHIYHLYQCGASYLKENGYCQISMRRFVKKGKENLAGVRECGFTGALSLGCGGRSYLGRLHTCTPYRITRQEAMEEIEAYQKREDFLPVTNGILLTDEEIKRRYVIRHLLILPGVSKQAYQKAFGGDVTDDFPVIREWMGQGWVSEQRCTKERNQAGKQDGLEEKNQTGEKDGVFFSLTEEGMGLSDYIGPQLISEAVREKMLEWEKWNGQENDLI